MFSKQRAPCLCFVVVRVGSKESLHGDLFGEFSKCEYLGFGCFMDDLMNISGSGLQIEFINSRKRIGL